MRLGVLVLPEFRWPDARAVWARVEELGFDHAWTYDHLAWRSLRDATWFGAVPFLAGAAAVTERVRLGTLVASPNFRHPVPFAREIVTLDDLSEGRLTVGFGSGGTGWDAVMLGQDPWSRAERTGRFEEFLVLLDLLLREPAVSFEGRYYRAVDARTYPGCVQRPRVPFAVAGNGPRGMRMAATLGGTWVTTGDTATRGDGAPLPPTKGARLVGDQMAMLDDACAAEGRDPRSIDRLVLTGFRLDPSLSSPAAFEDACGHYAAAGVTDLVVHWPRAGEPFAGDRSTFEQAVTAVVAHRRATP